MRVVLAALIAFAVSVVCLLPPGLHFVTGPLGPAIGGYVVGSRFRLSSTETAVVGLGMGLGITVALIVAFETLAFMPNLALRSSLPLSIVGGIYVGLLGGAGGWLARSRSKGA